MTPSRDISRLVEIMAALRTPDSGCPWDLEQNFATIVPFTIEEAYEVADAIDRGDFDDLRDELGDLLLQVVFHARMAEEAGRFNFGDVVQAVTEKLVRRHPHVFRAADECDAAPLQTAAVNALWDRIKAEEKEARRARQAGTPSGDGQRVAQEFVRNESALAGVPTNLPALSRALKLQNKAGKVGFDWNDPQAVLAKIREEADEIDAALAAEQPSHAAAETGDLLFAAVNLARHLGADPEALLRAANRKFEHRFAFIERALAEAGKTPQHSTLAEMDELWNRAKRAERSPPGPGAEVSRAVE